MMTLHSHADSSVGNLALAPKYQTYSPKETKELFAQCDWIFSACLEYQGRGIEVRTRSEDGIMEIAVEMPEVFTMTKTTDAKTKKQKFELVHSGTLEATIPKHRFYFSDFLDFAGQNCADPQNTVFVTRISIDSEGNCIGRIENEDTVIVIGKDQNIMTNGQKSKWITQYETSDRLTGWKNNGVTILQGIIERIEQTKKNKLKWNREEAKYSDLYRRDNLANLCVQLLEEIQMSDETFAAKKPEYELIAKEISALPKEYGQEVMAEFTKILHSLALNTIRLCEGKDLDAITQFAAEYSIDLKKILRSTAPDTRKAIAQFVVTKNLGDVSKSGKYKPNQLFEKFTQVGMMLDLEMQDMDAILQVSVRKVLASFSIRVEMGYLDMLNELLKKYQGETLPELSTKEGNIKTIMLNLKSTRAGNVEKQTEKYALFIEVAKRAGVDCEEAVRKEAALVLLNEQLKKTDENYIVQKLGDHGVIGEKLLAIHLINDPESGRSAELIKNAEAKKINVKYAAMEALLSFVWIEEAEESKGDAWLQKLKNTLEYLEEDKTPLEPEKKKEVIARLARTMEVRTSPEALGRMVKATKLLNDYGFDVDLASLFKEIMVEEASDPIGMQKAASVNGIEIEATLRDLENALKEDRLAAVIALAKTMGPEKKEEIGKICRRILLGTLASPRPLSGELFQTYVILDNGIKRHLKNPGEGDEMEKYLKACFKEIMEEIYRRIMESKYIEPDLLMNMISCKAKQATSTD